jgi:SAM-dependent methyltransferase
MTSTVAAANAYAVQGHDAVRETFELPWLGRLLPGLLHQAGGGEVLDLGCGDGAAARLAGDRLVRYLGVDLAPPETTAGLAFLRHDLREGLGPVGARPFDLYLATFGVASHLTTVELRRLLCEIASHARPGAVVALEALGLFSLEWPGIWDQPPGPARALSYRLAADVVVHPWAPRELHALLDAARLDPLGAYDRTLQAGPKTGQGGYWPGLPRLRDAFNRVLGGAPGEAALRELAAPLPPLPAGEPALLHHTLAARRARLVRSGRPPSAADLWRLEPPTRGGFGHGLLVTGRVR